MARQVIATVTCAGTPLAPTVDIQSLTLHQDLFGHHHFEVVVPFDSVEGPKEAFFSKAHKRLLGQQLGIKLVASTFQQNQGKEYQFQGLVTHIATSQDTDYTGSIIVRGYSPSYLLTDGQRRRTFVKQTLAAIFNDVLQAYPDNLLVHTVKPLHTAPIPFAAQYDETNFEFLSRLATEYGEWFYYDGDTLRLGAPVAGNEEIFIADGAYNDFTFTLALKPARVKMYEYSYQQNQQFKSSTSSQQVPGIQGHPFGKFALEASEKLFTGEAHLSAEMLIASAGELDEEAKMLKAHTAAELITFEGHSDNPALRVGGVIAVSGEGLGSRHITTENFGKYRIIRLAHHVDAAGTYSNTFTAIPHFLDVPPVQPGYTAPLGTPELAEVIDDADPDQLGRLRVRYGWPVAKPADAETDWVRVLTPYSGDGKGQLFKPEVGSQVLVGYQAGLAEQPFVLGNLFHANNKQKAKYSPAQNHLKGLQTAGGNKVVMSDKKGEQTILLSNSNNKGTAVQVGFKGDGSITIKSNGPVTVLSPTITLEAGDKGSIKLHAKTISMDADEEFTLSSKSKSITMKAKENISADATEKMDLKAKTKTITTTESLTISGGPLVDIKGGKVKVNS